ncbi:MAG: hypothetical protein ACKPEO_09760 [Sphaerospermopsis kisseleviana]
MSMSMQYMSLPIKAASEKKEIKESGVRSQKAGGRRQEAGGKSRGRASWWHSQSETGNEITR